MKICWDTLENLEYNQKKECLVFKRIVKNGENKGKVVRRYFYFTNCFYCNKEILSRNEYKRSFCDSKCKSYWFHSNKTEETKRKMSEKISETKKREKTGSKEWYIKKYGNEEGLIKYNYKLSITNNSLDSFILRHGKEIGTIKYNKFREKASIHNKIEGFIKRYGYEEGTRKWRKYIKTQRYKSSFEYYRVKYGDEALEKWRKEKIVNFKHYSKESMKLFQLLSKWLIDNNYCKENDIFMGDREYFLLNEGKGIYFYDFIILKPKILIEYNGTHIHPNPDNMDQEKWENWNHAFTKESADNAYKRDREKIQNAKNYGFNILEIWSDKDLDTNIELCKKFIDYIIIKN